ncbi:MAG TPA: hypothetical protein DDZ84_02820 [Firmicutes bacterium]|nr:hypothetical protein [Bacillota bacterium]
MANIVPQKPAFDVAEQYMTWQKWIEGGATVLSITGTLLSFCSCYTGAWAIAFGGASVLLTISVFFVQLRFATTYTEAEKIRRDGLIDSAFGSRLADRGAEGYYDNEGVNEGLGKLLTTIHQNSFVSDRTVTAMYRKVERLNVVAFIILLSVAVVSSVHSQAFIAILQAFLSLSFLGKAIKLGNLKKGLEQVNSNCKLIWEDIGYADEGQLDLICQGRIIREAIRYETMLSYASIMLDSKIYLRQNDEATDAWHDLRKRFNI